MMQVIRLARTRVLAEPASALNRSPHNTEAGRVRRPARYQTMRDKSKEKLLLVGFLKLLQDYPDAGIIAGIINRESADQVLRIEVNSLDISGYTLAMLADQLLERASEWLREDGLHDLASKVETAREALNFEGVDIRVKH